MSTLTAQINAQSLHEISKLVQLDLIMVESISAQRMPIPFTGGDLLVPYAFTTPWVRVDDRPGFDVVVDFNAALERSVTTNNEERVALMSFSLRTRLCYTLPERPSVGLDPSIDSFSQVNAVVNAWPYIRQEFSSMLSRMGLPAIVLPVYRPGRPSTGILSFQAP
ncbi:MAG: hypothetical protein RL199_2280 [Pseudomonadota bacterium]|jgi:hypothetical protein